MLHRIEGACALGIICADCPDRLIAARKDSPFILGCGEGFHFLASDVTAVIKHTREVIYLDDRSPCSLPMASRGHHLTPRQGRQGRAGRARRIPGDMDKLYIIARGSSYHVGMAAKYTLERLLRKNMEVTLRH